MMRGRFATAIVMAALLASTVAAFACKCASRSDLTGDGILANSDAVFTGVAVKTISVRAVGEERAPVSVTTFRVTEAFKGTKIGQTIRIRHHSGASSSCGVKFTRGETRTLSPSKSETLFHIGRCTAFIFEGEKGEGLLAQLRALGRPRR